MARVYTTQELIAILERERKACLKGQRLNLAATPYIGNSVVDYFLKPEGVQKFAAFQDFKATIHRYQQQHQVSGIVWQDVTVAGQTLRYPQVDDRLIALPSDIDTLKAAKSAIVQFWQQVTADMDLYLSINNGKDYRRITPPDVTVLDQRTEWANLWKWENTDFLEMVLQLGWGQPAEVSYRRRSSNAGSEQIHAVRPGKRPIC